MTSIISGIGAALPKTCVSNANFASMGIDSDWIVTRTGVKQRYHLKPDERLVDLATNAAAIAIEDAEIDASSVDMVIVATSTPDRISPGLAAELASLIGANHAGSTDINAACTGFLYALDYAIARVEKGVSDRVLVVGADAMSRLVDLTDPNMAFLFGDGAGAVIVEASKHLTCEVCEQYLRFSSDGASANHLSVERDTGLLRMHGGEVYNSAVENMAKEIENVLLDFGLNNDDIDYFVCHQANVRIVKAVARELGLPNEKTVSYVDQFGNTSAASIPIALWKAQEDQRLSPGNRLVLAAFGAGFTWGAGLVNWKRCQHK